MTRRPSPSFSLRCGLFLLLVTSSLVLTYLVLRPLAVAGTVPSPIYQYLDLNGEQNLIAWWNSGLLLLIAILSVLSAAAAPLARERLGFVVVALAGAYLSIDEFTMLHERYDEILGIEVDIGTYGWVVPGIGVALAGVTVLLFAGRGLPLTLRRALLLAMSLYLFGALFVEALSGFASIGNPDFESWIKALLIAVEEGLEMTACVVAVTALLVHLEQYGVLRVGTGPAREPTAPL
ncbi:MAG TPA: hypothetical protein VK045_07100 [Ornithinicoccus sp.]|nr:hypothetical protein [Ornithinicoccus sp.]